MIDPLRPQRQGGAGWPRAYDRQTLRQQLRRRGITPTIPPVARRRRRPTRGRPIRPGPNDRHRGQVERCFAWVDNGRRLVARYERSVEHYRAFGLLAILRWCVNLILK